VVATTFSLVGFLSGGLCEIRLVILDGGNYPHLWLHPALNVHIPGLYIINVQLK